MYAAAMTEMTRPITPKKILTTLNWTSMSDVEPELELALVLALVPTEAAARDAAPPPRPPPPLLAPPLRLTRGAAAAPAPDRRR